jgi:hypothetical protein
MSLSRYNKREVVTNISRDYAYSDIFRKRGLVTPMQYTIAEFKQLTQGEIMDLEIEEKLWTLGEKYFKLAHEFYGDPTYWWIIAWFNERPLESDFLPGEVVEIPTPLELILESLNIY